MSINQRHDLNNNAVFNHFVNNYQKSKDEEKRRHRNSYMRPILNDNRLQNQRRIEREAHLQSEQDYRRSVSKAQNELDFYGRELQELKEKIGARYYKDYKLDYLM